MRLDLQRYNRIIWAVNGTLLLAGALALLVGGVSALLPSRDRGQSLPAGTPSSPEGQPVRSAVLRLGLPKPLNGTDTLLVPVEGLPQEPEEPRGIGSYSKGAPTAPLFNLLFVDAKTQASHALLARKGLILHYDLLEEGEEGRGGKVVALMVRLVDSDTNKNGRLDEADEARIYLCDPTGRNLRPITPGGLACDTWQYDSARRTLYLVVRPGGSEGSDSTDVLAIPLDGAHPARSLVPKSQVDDLRAILQR